MDAKIKPDAYGELIEPTTLKIQRLLPGPIERIWAYLTDSELRRKWLAAGAMEMKVGAPFELVWRNDELNDPPSARPDGFSRRAPHAEPDHRTRSAAQAFDRLEQQRRRHLRTGAQGRGRAAHRDPSPSARPLDHAQGQRRLAHASRYSCRSRRRATSRRRSGTAGAVCRRNTTGGFRPEAASRRRT